MTTLDPSTFIETISKYKGFNALRPELVDLFLTLEDSTDSAVLCGGSWGRTTLATIRLLYAIHRFWSSRTEADEAPTAAFVIQGDAEGTRMRILDPIETILRKESLFEGIFGERQASLLWFRGKAGCITSRPWACNTVLRVAGGIMDGEAPTGFRRDQQTFARLRRRMREEGPTGWWKGSLTWCASHSIVSCDPMTAVTVLPGWAKAPQVAGSDIGAWVILQDGRATLTEDRTVAWISATKRGVGVFGIPLPHREEFRSDLAAALERHYGVFTI